MKSSWIEAFPVGYRISQTVKVHLIQIFSRFGIPRILVSDNGPEFASIDLKQWCESLRVKKMKSPIYHPRANGIAERAVRETGYSSLDSKSDCVIWRFPTAGFDDTSEHFQDARQNS